MPMIAYACQNPKCGLVIKKFSRQAKDVPVSLPCPREECYGDMKKQLSAPSQVSKIVVDNGFQARQVEVHPDIVQINQERSEKNYRED